jgi:hypothetical protein
MEGKGTGGWSVVRSPHDGREVKVRLKDLGRTVRDSDNKPFYLLKRADGSANYGSLTREGGPDQEAAYDRMIAREGHTKQTGAVTTQVQVHDATGKGRGGSKGKLILLIIIILLGVAAWAFLWGPLKGKDLNQIQEDIKKKIKPQSSGSSSYRTLPQPAGQWVLVLDRTYPRKRV